MSSFNNVTFVGNLTKDAEVFESENSRAKFSIAINDYKDNTMFMNCTAWGKLATSVGPNLKKGQKILVNGRLSIDEWENSEGVKCTAPAVTAFSVVYLTPKGEANNTPAKAPSDIDVPF